MDLNRYSTLSLKAKSLGLNWVFNSIEGLEFAIEFFSEKPKPEHEFGYNRQCIRCGITQEQLMSMPTEYKGKGECYTYKMLKEKGIKFESLYQ